MLNMVSSVLGDVLRIMVISQGRKWGGIDPEPDLKIEFKNGEAIFLAGNEEDFSYNQMELVGPKGKVLFDTDGRLFWWGIKKDPKFDNYVFLQKIPHEIPTDMKRYQYNVLQNISDYLSGCSPLFCDGNSGLETMQILNKIQEELK